MTRRVFAILAVLAVPFAMFAAGKPEAKTTVDKLMMFSVAVSDMPKARAFYADELGLRVTSDHRINDLNWWVSLAFPEGGASIVLTTAHENMKPGSMKLYLTSSDIAAAHDNLVQKSARVSEINDDLFGPGSGVKWFSLADPDGNQVLLVQAAR